MKAHFAIALITAVAFGGTAYAGTMSSTPSTGTTTGMVQKPVKPMNKMQKPKAMKNAMAPATTMTPAMPSTAMAPAPANANMMKGNGSN